MSGQLPQRRRRIAGERRPATPTAPGAEPTEPTERSDPSAPAEDLAPGSAPAEDVALEPERRRGWWGSTASLVALTVALVLLLTVTGLGLAGLLGNRGLPGIREAAQVTDAVETAPSVAERAAEAILAYDHRTLDADQDAAQRFMTPEFAKTYADTFTRTVKPAARTFKAQVSSEVQGSSVVRATADRVRVLVFVDQTTVATNKKNPQVALNRVEFDMVRRGGSWLVDGITSY